MKVPEQFRLRTGRYGTTSGHGNNGMFFIKKKNIKFQIIASDGMGWDHVSVTLINKKRTPTWDEMCYIKGLFFNERECVVQFHPAREDYVNNHKYCLHLWRSQDKPLPTPAKIMV